MSTLKTLAELASTITVGYLAEDAIKLKTPKDLTGIKEFGAKVGTSMVGSIVGGFVTEILSRNITDIVETVKSVDLEKDQED